MICFPHPIGTSLNLFGVLTINRNDGHSSRYLDVRFRSNDCTTITVQLLQAYI